MTETDLFSWNVKLELIKINMLTIMQNCTTEIVYCQVYLMQVEFRSSPEIMLRRNNDTTNHQFGY